MGYFANSIPVLSAATRTVSSHSSGVAVGNYIEGHLFIYVSALAGTGARLTPRWEGSPNGNVGTAGYYLPLRAFATSIRATGLAMMTLPAFGKWGRVAYTVGGTSAAIKFSGWFVGKGMYPG